MASVFLSAPHRMMFFAGAVQALVAMLFWAFDLGARYADLYGAVTWGRPAVWLHGAVMLYGLFPLFIFGFLMTALPKWVSAPSLAPSCYQPAFFFLAGGWLLFWLGLALPLLQPLGLGLVLLGWVWGWSGLWRAVRWPQPAAFGVDRSHAYAILAALAIGAAGLLIYAWGMAAMAPGWVRSGIELGIWGFLLPIFFIVSHRMLPFFSGAVLKGYQVYRPMPLLWAMLGCFAAHGVLALAGLRVWLWLPDAAAAILAFHCSWKWQIRRALRVPMLAMLHVSTLWLGLGLSLYVVQSLVLAAGGSWAGLAPLHAISIGYFASMLLGMATRVTLGHSGRAIAEGDKWTWPLFWLFQLIPLLRIAGEFFPVPGVLNLQWLAALGWLVVFGTWCWLHLGIYLRPRPDGQPG
ncbi:MAG TPA: NnrS family protein [Azospira sp.]|nr:NnrS family protein [Azospira sp.]